jgi:predicted branched-subunit amino acid permease
MSRDVDAATPPAYPIPAGARDLVAGARAVLPAVLAFAPLALMVGAAVAASDNRLAAWLSTWTIHGGAAQLITLDTVAEQSGWVAAATAGLLVQTRLSAYSTAMVADWRTAPLGHRLLAGLLLSDAPWALAQSRSTGRRGFYLGAGLALFVAWPAMVTVGTAVGDNVDGFAAAALVPALVLGCTVVTQLRQRPVLVAATAAGLSAGITVVAPVGVSLIGAAVVGIVAALVADRPVGDRAAVVAS